MFFDKIIFFRMKNARKTSLRADSGCIYLRYYITGVENVPAQRRNFMSSLPGFKLEDYVAWNHDLKIIDQDEANASLGIAEMLGRSTGRLTLTIEEFAPILQIYEPHRERIEYYLGEFDDETQNWRDYSYAAFQFVPESVATTVLELIRGIRRNQ